MARPCVKICGNTNLYDARISLECGADMLGFIFFSKSPRYIAPEEARDIILTLKTDFLFKSIGVFVNPSKNFVEDIIKITDIDILQFHGEEPLEFIKSFNKKVIKVFRIRNESDVLKCYEYDTADYFLLDAFSKDAYGGTGRIFNWELLREFKFRDNDFSA